MVDLEPLQSGTLVVWTQLEGVVESNDLEDDAAEDELSDAADKIRAYLALAYHRVLEGSRPALKLYLNGSSEEHRIRPTDPFEQGHAATQQLPEARRGTSSGMVALQGYVLPHRDRRGAETRDAEPGRAVPAHGQGFYVYRADRLIVAGSWLGLGDPEPWMQDQQHRLARIRLDIPAEGDRAWRVGIRRNEAHPPPELREWLARHGERVRRAAREVFVHRGNLPSLTTRAESESVWQADAIAPLTYRVNRAHPLIADLLQSCSADKVLLERALRLVEATIPIHRIWLDVAEDPEAPSPLERMLTTTEIAELAEYLVGRLLAGREITRAAALRRLARVEPFDRHLKGADSPDE